MKPDSVTETSEVVRTKMLTAFDESRPLRLQSGATLTPVTVAYETYGELNNEGTNAILVCHALTADAHAAGIHSSSDPVPGWWDGLIGPGRALDTDRYFVVCPNILGSCYGTTGPVSINPATGQKYVNEFPELNVRDIVTVQKRTLDLLGVNRLVTAVGSSLGGMQALEWAIMHPEFCESVIPISASAAQSAWCIALNSIVRASILNDPVWANGNYRKQPEGMGVARMVGMISYRSPDELEQRFGRNRQVSGDVFDAGNLFQVESYLRHQAQKLLDRFDANTYLTLSRATDRHDIAEGRGETQEILRSIQIPLLSIGVSSDIRYPIREQKYLAGLASKGRYAEVSSFHGHDAFLIEFDQLNSIIGNFLNE